MKILIACQKTILPQKDSIFYAIILPDSSQQKKAVKRMDKRVHVQAGQKQTQDFEPSTL